MTGRVPQAEAERDHAHRRSHGPRAAIARAAGFLGLWLVIAGADTSDLLVGLAAVAAATWTSLRLLPPGRASMRTAALVGFVLRFLGQSAVAGADVAWRALDPRLPLRPGFVRCPVRVAPGPAQDAFRAVSSLLPGSLPVASDDGDTLLLHCLDVAQPAAAQMAATEARFLRAFGLRADD